MAAAVPRGEEGGGVMHGSGYRKHKRDATQGEVAETLEAFGWSVEDNSAAGEGKPDLIIGRDGITDMVEVKRDAKAGYTPAQRKFNQTWRGADPIRLENKVQAEAWCRRTIRDRQAQSRANAHRALTPLLVVPEPGPRGEYHGRNEEGK